MKSVSLPHSVSRRGLLIGMSAAGGLAIGFPMAARAKQSATIADADSAKELTAFLLIDPDNTITVRVPQSEMGQGTATGLAMLLAEELECDWAKVRFEHASPNRNSRQSSVYGGMMTVGSGGLRGSAKTMQLAGATARERLRLAAAEMWKTPVAECTVELGSCFHRLSNRRADFGSLAQLAAKVELKAEPKIKTPDQFKLVGKWTPRLDTAVKLDGSAQYGIDANPPGVVYAAASGCPVFGGVLKSVDESALTGMRGIIRVVKLKDSVVVVADRFWRAKAAVDALKIEWDVGDAGKVQNADLTQALVKALDEEMVVYKKEGDAAAAFAAPGGNTIEAVYEAPLLSHNPLEPPNCTISITPNRVDIWMGTQNPMGVMQLTSSMTGIAPENIHIHNAFLGGGFGRRFLVDEVAQAIEVAKVIDKPVKLVWTREQDTLRGRFRPHAAAGFKAKLVDGKFTAFQTRIAVPSIGRSLVNGGPPGPFGPPRGPMDPTAMQSITEAQYTFPNKLLEATLKNSHVPVTYWRSVGASQNCYFYESFVDEMAHAAGVDPYKFRRASLTNPDWLRVLDLAAEKSGWGQPLPPGKGRGIAIVGDFGSICCQVWDVTVSADGKLKVDRVVVALDPNNVVNPNTIHQQMESGVIYGLTAALYGEITIKDGAAVETNFNRNRMVRMAETPSVIDIYLTPSGGSRWGGVGETGLPPVAPALCNAIFAATGKRIRRLPLKNADLKSV